MKAKVLCVVGPTATGKSDFGIYLAEQFNGEIVSADSMQVYIGMDIGTAKLTAQEQRGIPHYLLNVVHPNEIFTVARWTRLADACIADIVARNKVPIVVGGTGLYIRSITNDLDFAHVAAEPEIREKWNCYLDAYGKQALHDALREHDPVTAQRLHVNDTRRVIRALEVMDTRGQPMSSMYDWSSIAGRYETFQLGLSYSRDVLYARVNARVNRMIEMGLEDEVKRLLDTGYGPQWPALQAIGYKEWFDYFQGGASRTSVVEQIQQNTRRFVKRQESWFRRDNRIAWVEALNETAQPSLYSDVLRNVSEFLAGIPAWKHE